MCFLVYKDDNLVYVSYSVLKYHYLPVRMLDKVHHSLVQYFNALDNRFLSLIAWFELN